MEEWMIYLLKDFIGEHWSVFEEFCNYRGKDIAEEIYNALEKEINK